MNSAPTREQWAQMELDLRVCKSSTHRPKCVYSVRVTGVWPAGALFSVHDSPGAKVSTAAWVSGRPIFSDIPCPPSGQRHRRYQGQRVNGIVPHAEICVDIYDFSITRAPT